MSLWSSAFCEPVILRLALVGRGARRHVGPIEHAGEIDPLRLGVADAAAHREPVGAADHLVEAAEAELRHQLAHFLGEEVEEGDHVLGPAVEAAPELGILRRDADRAGVEVALAHHHAALGDERGGGDAELVGAQERAHHHVAAGADAAIDLHRDAAAQAVEDERLVGFGEADLPRLAGVMDRGQGRGAGAALVAGDGDVVGIGLGDAGGDGADADLGDELDADRGARIDVLQIVDELRQILDRVDVVVRRRRDEADAGDRVAHAGDPVIDLVAGKLAALAGLGALRHLDLQHVGVDEIIGIDAEPAGGDLLDRRAHRIAVGHALVALRVLAALAGVGLAAHAVHRDGERGVRLPRDGAERHGAGREAPDDRRGGLDLGQRNGVLGELEVEQAAQRDEAVLLLADAAGEFLELAVIVAAHRVLEQGHGVRRPDMPLAVDAEGELAARVERLAIVGRVAEGNAMAPHRLVGDLVETDALDRRHRPGEIFVEEDAVEPDGVEDLRAAIGLEGADAHLGHHFEDALGDRLDVALLRLARRQLALKLALERGQRIEGEIGIDRLGAVAREEAEIVELPRLAGLDDEPQFGAQAAADKVVMHRRRGEERGHRDGVGIERAVRQHDDVVAGAHRVLGGAADAVERARSCRQRPRRAG